MEVFRFQFAVWKSEAESHGSGVIEEDMLHNLEE
jgi:hypothetical protein